MEQEVDVATEQHGRALPGTHRVLLDAKPAGAQGLELAGRYER
jgi:hypothetical protein